MHSVVLNIYDESKTPALLGLLRDLRYVTIAERPAKRPKTHFVDISRTYCDNSIDDEEIDRLFARDKNTNERETPIDFADK